LYRLQGRLKPFLLLQRMLLKMVESKYRAQFLQSRLDVRDLQLQLAADAADLGVWTWEPSTDEVTSSRRCQALMGVDASENLSLNTFLGRVHTDDHSRVKRALSAALQLKREFSFKFRVLSASGEIRRFNCVGRIHPSLTHKSQVALSCILREIVEGQKMLSDELVKQLRATASHSESLRKVERVELTNRLKSEISTCLASVKDGLNTISGSGNVAPNLSASLSELASKAEAGLESIRHTIFELQPPGVEELGFVGALERMVTDRGARAGLQISLSLPSEAIQGDLSAQLALYAAAESAIDNVIRHADAKRVDVIVTSTVNELRLRMVDDGIGMDEKDLLKEGGFSLIAAIDRLSSLGGSLRAVGVTGRGTTLEAKVPLVAKKSRRPPIENHGR
jgi:two-component system, NarL family, sensor histidine kinase UhpB